MRLIDADALMDVIRQHEYRLATKQGSIDYGMFTLGIQQAVDEQPTVDAVPVRHGRWEIVVGSNGKEYMVCTCCRVSQDLTGVFTYCPNCGAKMDGGAE